MECWNTIFWSRDTGSHHNLVYTLSSNFWLLLRKLAYTLYLHQHASKIMGKLWVNSVGLFTCTCSTVLIYRLACLRTLLSTVQLIHNARALWVRHCSSVHWPWAINSKQSFVYILTLVNWSAELSSISLCVECFSVASITFSFLDVKAAWRIVMLGSRARATNSISYIVFSVRKINLLVKLSWLQLTVNANYTAAMSCWWHVLPARSIKCTCSSVQLLEKWCICAPNWGHDDMAYAHTEPLLITVRFNESLIRVRKGFKNAGSRIFAGFAYIRVIRTWKPLLFPSRAI